MQIIILVKAGIKNNNICPHQINSSEIPITQKIISLNHLIRHMYKRIDLIMG